MMRKQVDTSYIGEQEKNTTSKQQHQLNRFFIQLSMTFFVLSTRILTARF